MDINETLKERGSRYGTFGEHGRITQAIKDALRSGKSWPLMLPDQREAVDMIAHKLGRIVGGDPNYSDSWHDIIGYTKLIEDRLD